MRPLCFLLRHARRIQRCGFARAQADLPRLRRGPCQISLLLPSKKTQCPHKPPSMITIWKTGAKRTNLSLTEVHAGEGLVFLDLTDQTLRTGECFFIADLL